MDAVVGGGVGFVEVGGGAVGVVDGPVGVVVGPVGRVVPGPGGPRPGRDGPPPDVGGTVVGSEGATDGAVVGVQPAGMDVGGSETVPVGATRSEPNGIGRIAENASAREAGVRSQFTPGGTCPPE